VTEASAENAPATLLYVEDEILIQDAVETALREAGFDVIVASDGDEAIAALRDGHTFRGLVTDINLGTGPDGWAVARIAREVTPGLPVVYLSGASGHQWTSHGVPQSVMVAKPFANTQVVVAIAGLLNTSDMPG